MAHAQRTPLPGLPPIKGGREMLIGMAVVGSGLATFYMGLRWHQSRKEASGSVPHYETLLAHVGTTQVSDIVPLAASRVENRRTLLPAPLREHNSGHSTIADYKASPGYTPEGRRMAPPPQRAKDDGSGRAYTKSPDYVKNYEKTMRHKTKEVTEDLGA